jgi:hypothetical protein
MTGDRSTSGDAAEYGIGGRIGRPVVGRLAQNCDSFYLD